MKRSIWIGFDPREASAFAVARHSIRKHLATDIPIHGVVLSDLRAAGLYSRPTSRRDGRLWDDISGAPMSTEFAVARFLVRHLAKEGWALFVDGDFLARSSVEELFDNADPSKAAMVVKHQYEPIEGIKMDGQLQLRYARKNWSSAMLVNCDHEANKALTVEYVNTVPGRDLHAFQWLPDDLIGEMAPQWNHLVGERPYDDSAKLVHFTLGVPDMLGYEACDFSDAWRAELADWAR